METDRRLRRQPLRSKSSASLVAPTRVRYHVIHSQRPLANIEQKWKRNALKGESYLSRSMVPLGDGSSYNVSHDSQFSQHVRGDSSAHYNQPSIRVAWQL